MSLKYRLSTLVSVSALAQFTQIVMLAQPLHCSGMTKRDHKGTFVVPVLQYL